jgi:broad specificity phosphatase PhoE
LEETTRVLLLRHAETSAPDRFHGAESDVGLGDRGVRQALAVADWLASQHPTAVYSSAMRRAVATAEPIGRACGVTPIIEPDLHERRMGHLSGLTREGGAQAYSDAKRRWMAGETSYTHEGGESFDDIKARVLPIWRRITSEREGTTIVVVAHGVVIRILLTTILDHLGPADFERLAIDNTAVNDLRGAGDQWRAEALNLHVGAGAGAEFDRFAW